jgi:hypothetical protein
MLLCDEDEGEGPAVATPNFRVQPLIASFERMTFAPVTFYSDL